MDIDKNELEKRFSYHAPKDDQIGRYTQIRAKAKEFAELIVSLSPTSREQSLAITELEYCVMMVNAAIARNDNLPVNLPDGYRERLPEGYSIRLSVSMGRGQYFAWYHENLISVFHFRTYENAVEAVKTHNIARLKGTTDSMNKEELAKMIKEYEELSIKAEEIRWQDVNFTSKYYISTKSLNELSQLYQAMAILQGKAEELGLVIEYESLGGKHYRTRFAVNPSGQN